MKKIICYLVLLFPIALMAQSVAINTDGALPDNSSILDIKSSGKGLLIPRMNSLTRTGIPSPAIGLTVFDTETNSHWVYRGDINGGWTELQHSLQNQWTSSGIDIFNKNNGNVGIGTSMPAMKLTLNGNNPGIGIMNNGLAHGYIQAEGNNMAISTAPDNPVGKLVLGTKGNDNFNIDYLGRVSIGTSSSFDANLKLNGSSPVFGFLHNDVQKGFIRVAGDNFKMGTYPGNSGAIVFSPKNIDKMWIDEDGKVSIGNHIPAGELTINGINTTLQMQHSGINKGFLQAFGSDLRLGTNSNNSTGNLILQTKETDRLVIDENGLVGIGTTTPSTALTINGTDPQIQLRNGNVDKGFIQLWGPHLRVGTNASNNFASFIVRTNANDRFYVNYRGQLGVNAIPDDTKTTVTIAEDDNGNSGIELVYGGQRRGMFNYNGTNTFLTASTGYLYMYRNSSYPFVFHPGGDFSLGGHNAANGYRLSIYGKAIATEFTALPYNNWPDYVFEKNYRLMPLSELKEFIASNKHLPSVPKAEQMEKDGIPLGEMTRKLMEKVEELTLYVIQQQEQIDQLKKELGQKDKK